ncbi:hypothetical protein [Sulfuricurvum sp.]|uniref:hypothetical protein n=1 Tax=Sulfuricurvum sp. TaxID=2025608 RepID=UPI0026382B53|nr:hypothetical protein [Sulfuricurvum sp.]MDD2267475.1 hypothetical protein [Sulfuricurvum sp.]MDD2783977.1 hypothetical protein [Sulfuricurvum sp.]
MKQTERKNQGTMIVPLSNGNVGDSSVVIAILPIGTRIKNVNVTVDEAFTNADNTITVGVSGAASKFQNAFALNAVAGNNATRQHTITGTTTEIIMSVAGTASTTGVANVTIDYVLPTEYSVEY